MRISDWSSDVCSSDLGDVCDDRPPVELLQQSQHVLHDADDGVADGCANGPCDARHVPVETAKHASAAGIDCSLLRELCAHPDPDNEDRKSTRLNSSH